MMENAPTRSALLRAREERQVMGEGFRFLDEKRLLLAAEMARQFEHYRRVRTQWLQMQQEAVLSLRQALSRHGLQGLQVQAAAADEEVVIQREVRHFFGVVLLDAVSLPPGQGEGSAGEALNRSPESRLLQQTFAHLVRISAELAALSGNVQRLLAEYKRTERRARALENVLLPELEQGIHAMELHMEEMEQEEAVRVRLKRVND
ncbi:MAG: V-type ATP synthase subunit D [Magnetococcales bacterium]|nr:V-type ATP synthase subunit D [Magnetococcales bacterium]